MEDEGDLPLLAFSSSHQLFPETLLTSKERRGMLL